MLRLLGVELDVVSEQYENGDGPGRPRLVVANHRSTVDILVMLHLFGGQLLARSDMATWPAVGPLARRAGTLFVDRASPASGAAAVRQMRERLRRNITLCVFPEGTTFPGDQVRGFRPGAFLAISREHGDVVPVGIAYQQEEAFYGDEPVLEHMKRLLKTKRIRVSVVIGRAREADALSLQDLAEQAQEDVQQLVDLARARVSRGST
jgi:1-acyl-sn-glycerol-3-phosphate acyltransferase